MLDMIEEPSSREIVKGWLERGDGCAVYQNKAMDSRNLGHRKFVSFGGERAQLETDEPPTRLPDIGGATNWAYQLEGTVRRKS